jgi:hypothetical protein
MTITTAPRCQIAPILLAAVGLAIGQATRGALAQGGGDPLAEPFPVVFELSSLHPSMGGDGSLGYLLISSREDDALGTALGMGDIDGDGLDDVVVGSPTWSHAGQVSVVFGTEPTRPPRLDLRNLDGLWGLSVRPVSWPPRRVGHSIAVAEVTGDGWEDVLIGAPWTTEDVGCERTGNAYLLDGLPRGVLPAVRQVESLPSLGLFCGYYDYFGQVVAANGDLDGDGLGDVIVGAPRGTLSFASRSEAYVIYGAPGGPLPTEPQRTLVVRGSVRDSGLPGEAVFLGDINGDGFDEMLISEPEPGPGSGLTAYVFFGGTRATGTFNIAGFGSDDGVVLRETGWPVGQAAFGHIGDVNGDGRDDFAFTDAGSGSGKVYVVFGRSADAEPLPAVLGPSDIDGENGFTIVGPNFGEGFGRSVASAGDVNNDGVDDLVVGAPDADPAGRSGAGAAFIIFGRDGDFPERLVAEPGEGVARINGIDPQDAAGLSLAGAGDVNGDGVDDLVIGAPRAGDVPSSGEAYVLFGRYALCRVDLDRDGELTIFDFLVFQNYFDAGNPIADIDNDDELTIFDFLTYQNAFDAGCP